MKSTLFWGITPCNPLKVNRRFGGAYRLHLQGRRINRATTQRKSRWQAGKQTLLAAYFYTGFCSVPPKRRLTFNGLHGVISQKIVLFNIMMFH
jgi:hypothetical protein